MLSPTSNFLPCSIELTLIIFVCCLIIFCLALYKYMYARVVIIILAKTQDVKDRQVLISLCAAFHINVTNKPIRSIPICFHTSVTGIGCSSAFTLFSRLLPRWHVSHLLQYSAASFTIPFHQ